MELFVMRHGIAADRETWRGSDADRPLTERGAARVERVTEALGIFVERFDRIVTSPYVRARETAEIVARHRGGGRDPELDRVLAFEDPGPLLTRLARSDDERVLLVGHEPCLSSLVSRLVAGRDTFAFRMKKAAIAKLVTTTLERGEAELEWLLPPKAWLAMRTAEAGPSPR